MTATHIIILIATGLIAGLVSGTMGVGGGIIIVPSLVFIMGLTQHQAQGTSLAMMIAPIGLVSALNYYKEGYVNFRFALILLIAFFLGSYLGSLLAVNLPDKILKQIFGVFMILVGIKMVMNR